jgi:hypothetical protein
MSATVVILLCALACPLSMLLMMLFMRKGHGVSRDTDAIEKRESPSGDAK